MAKKTKSEPGTPTLKGLDLAALRVAVGSSDPEFQNERITEVAGVVRLHADMSKDEQFAKIGAALETLAEIAPHDGTERMLAVQMVGCHEAAVECLRRAMLPGQTFEGRDMALKHAEKLMATYARLLATLDKHRGKGQQKVTVEHVYVEAGGQAIVGNVEGRGQGRPPRQEPRALEHAPGVPVDPVKAPQKAPRKRRREGDR